MTQAHPDGVRLQKVLAQAGVASRRAAEELISAGRVTVDGEVVREMGRRVHPDKVVVHVDGLRIVLDDTLTYLALNKPRGVLSTMHDDQGRRCVGDLLVERGAMDEHFDGGARARLFHVGRLDAETEGLLLLMNDGELGHRLMHPSFEVEKTYSPRCRARSRATSADGCARASTWRTGPRWSTGSAWSTRTRAGR